MKQSMSAAPAASTTRASVPTACAAADGLWAGIGRADITDYEAGPVNDPLLSKALVLRQGATVVVLVTVDAVALGEIGRIPNDFLERLRAAVGAEPGLAEARLVVNASHCHGVVCKDIVPQTLEAIRTAWQAMVPVRAGAGCGHEDRIMENRRMRLQDGHEADVRHAYGLPTDARVEAVGPIDPQIGILRLDRLDGKTLAVVYTIACHPIQGVPGGGNTADLVGVASRTLEDALGHDAMAFFFQGCAGDINPVGYKDFDHPRDAVPLGIMLGLSTLRALPAITCRADATLRLTTRSIDLPRADLAPAIADLLAEQERLLQSLRGTTLNAKAFLKLLLKQRLWPEYPSADAHHYLHERAQGRDDLARFDAANRRHVEAYQGNLETMEALTRLRANLDLLRMHQAQNAAAGSDSLTVEVVALRVGDFVLLTFPGELSVQIGLNLKQASPHPLTFVAGCTNGYIYYAPTVEQLRNRGWAQEDSDCLLAPEWQARFEQTAQAMLTAL